MRRYQNIPVLTNSPIKEGKRFYSTIKYPEIPLSVSDIYVITQQGDRFDILANQYYQDKSLWWIISIANNNLIQNSLIPPVGIQIRIPVNISEILNSYNKLNQNV
jgi:phage tail protein X